jgi:hypothetical protein
LCLRGGFGVGVCGRGDRVLGDAVGGEDGEEGGLGEGEAEGAEGDAEFVVV